MASSQLDDYVRAKARAQASSGSLGGCNSHWKPPEQGYIKINTDASLILGEGVAVRGVAWNDRGEVQWCFSELSNYNPDVEIAESLAILRAMKIALSNGVQNVIFETDAQIVFYAFNSAKTGFLILWWVRRTGNSVAHSMTSMAFSSEEPFLSDAIPSE
ncbi:hypothetical protein ACS0TY_007518 [Phlomoides rotata]